MDFKSMLFFLTAITALAGFSEWMNPTKVTPRTATAIEFVRMDSTCAKGGAPLELLPLPTPAKILQSACVYRWDEASN